MWVICADQDGVVLRSGILWWSVLVQKMVSVHPSGFDIGFLNQMAWVASVLEVGCKIQGISVKICQITTDLSDPK